MYDNIDPSEAYDNICHLIDEAYGKSNNTYIQYFKEFDGGFWKAGVSPGNSIHLDKAKLKNMLHFLLFNQYFTVGESAYQQIKGIPMGSSPAPHIANMHLFYKERDYVRKNPDKFKEVKICRFLDDVLSFGVSNFCDLAPDIYGDKLPFKADPPIQGSLNFLDITILKNHNNTYSYKTYDSLATLFK